MDFRYWVGLGILMKAAIQRLLLRLVGLEKLMRWMSPMFAHALLHPWLVAGFFISSCGTRWAENVFHLTDAR